MTRFSGFAQARPESKSKTYNDLAEGSTGFEALGKPGGGGYLPRR